MLPQYIDKNRHLVQIKVCGVISRDFHIMLPFRGYTDRDQESGCWMTLHRVSRLYIMSPKLENPVLKKWKKFFDLITQISGCLTPLIENLLWRGWARDQQNSEQHQKWTKSKINVSIYQFKQGALGKGLKEVPNLSGCRGWSQLQFIWINLIYTISSRQRSCRYCYMDALLGR